MSTSKQYFKDDNSVDLDSDSNSLTEHTPKLRLTRRKISVATRRRSTMLYLEKYGLDQPDWHKSSQDDNDEEESDREKHNEDMEDMEFTEEPESIFSATTTTTSYTTAAPAAFVPYTQAIIGDFPVKRPVSIRNSVQNSAHQKRPTKFIKPQKSSKNGVVKTELPPSEFNHVHLMLEEYTGKVYMEGYLHKRNDLNSDGSSCEPKNWSLWYVELCGPILTLWDSEKKDEEDVSPQYINITDSTVKIEAIVTTKTRPNTFSLNSAGANRFLLQAANSEALYKWVLAIRLSCFECSRIQEIYTKAFISRPQFIDCFNSSSLKNNDKHGIISSKKGYVQVRFPGATGWRELWAVASNRKTEKGLFSKKSIPTQGQIMFFESKKAKSPMMILENVVQAYTVYPESPKLIKMATLFKIEGSLYKDRQEHGQQLISTSSSALVMASNTNELVEWLVGIYDTFKLYGRPSTLLDNPMNPNTLNFAQQYKERLCTPRLFLELDDVVSVDPRPSSTLLSNKKLFNKILLDHLLNPPKRLTSSANSATEIGTASHNRSSVSNHQSKSNPLITQPTQLRTMTCASDVSDEDEEDQDDTTEESDSDESLFKLSVNKIHSNKSAITSDTKLTAVKPITPNASNSSSEISSKSSTHNNIPPPTKIILPSVGDITGDNFAENILNVHGFDSSDNGTTRHTDEKLKYPTAAAADKHDENTVENTATIAATTSDSDGSSSNNTTTNRPLYAQQKYYQQKHRTNGKANSMMPSPAASSTPLMKWPMYGSTGTIISGDYGRSNRNDSSKWETSSVDPHMMGGGSGETSYFSSHESIPYQYATSTTGYFDNRQEFNGEDDDDDDDIPIADTSLFTQNSLLDQAGEGSSRMAKQIEEHARNTGQPLVQMPNSRKRQPRAGLLGVISEKEQEKESGDVLQRRNTQEEQAMLQERMMMEQRQQQMMMQQYMQQYQMMMPMMPMVDPRTMSYNGSPMTPYPNPPMMMNPQFMMQQPFGYIPSPSVSSGSHSVNSSDNYHSRASSRASYQQHRPKDENSSMIMNHRTSYQPNKQKKRMSSVSSATSVHSTAIDPRYGSPAVASSRNFRNH